MKDQSAYKCRLPDHPPLPRQGDFPPTRSALIFDRRLAALQLICRLRKSGLPAGKAAELAGMSSTTLWRLRQRVLFAGAQALEPRYSVSGRMSKARRVAQAAAAAQVIEELRGEGFEGQSLYREAAKRLYHRVSSRTLQKLCPKLPKSVFAE